MSSIGQLFRLFDDMGATAYLLLLLAAIVSVWLGVRYSRPRG
jgi:hypothetical protein